jgi:hypothetical protein
MIEPGMGQRTRWLDPQALINCEYGSVSVLTWLTRELERIKSRGRLVEIRQSEAQGSSKVALFVK